MRCSLERRLHREVSVASCPEHIWLWKQDAEPIGKTVPDIC